MITLDNRADADLFYLGRQLDELEARKIACADTDDDDVDDQIYSAHWALREKINNIAAKTVKELQVKARAAEYALRHDPNAECDALGSFVELSRSIGRDLLAIDI